MHDTPTTAESSTRTVSDLSALRLLNQEFIRAVGASDAAWFDKHLSSDFVNSNPDGTLSERAAFLQHVARPSAVSRLRADDVRIRLFGDSALVHASTHYIKANGEPGSGRYTDVWARFDGAWRCVAADVTRC
jgi:ketosteroid isomerase-like protein